MTDADEREREEEWLQERQDGWPRDEASERHHRDDPDDRVARHLHDRDG